MPLFKILFFILLIINLVTSETKIDERVAEIETKLDTLMAQMKAIIQAMKGEVLFHPNAKLPGDKVTLHSVKYFHYKRIALFTNFNKERLFTRKYSFTSLSEGTK